MEDAPVDPLTQLLNGPSLDPPGAVPHERLDRSEELRFESTSAFETTGPENRTPLGWMSGKLVRQCRETSNGQHD
jgi:hypothetical protein